MVKRRLFSAKMPLVKTVKEGDVTTEIHDLMEGVGDLSADQVLERTGAKAGQFTEIQPDGSKITYFVEEASITMQFNQFLLLII